MLRNLFLLLLLLLPACQGVGHHQSAASLSDTFDRATVQTYDIQTGEYHQQPPWGERSNQSQ